MTLLKKILLTTALVAVVLPAGSAMAAPKSKFRFSQATYVASEAQGTLDVTITRTARHGHSRVNQTSSVNFSVTGGSATDGTDYTLDPVPGKLTFTSGQTSKTVTVHITQDTDIEGLETIGLKLSSASRNALITSPRTSQVLIADDDGPTQIQLAPASQNVNEGAGNATFLAVRSGDNTGNSTVDYATSDGSAVHPADYADTHGSLSYAIADFSKPINVPIADDSLIENPETFSLTLSNITGATFPNAQSSVTASTTIVDNDSPPIFVLDASSYEVNENGSVDVTVLRQGNAAAPTPVSANDVFNVDWGTSDGTATNPADYLPGSDNTLEFDSSDDAETITISATDADTQIGLVDDALAEGDETFGLALTGASIAPGGSGIQPSLGTPSNATVTIHDNDTPAGGGTPGGGNANPVGDTGGSGGSTTGTGTGEANGQAVLGARAAACGLVVKVAKKQKLLKQKGLKLKLRSGKACKIALATSIKELKPKKKRAEIVRALRFKGKKTSLALKPGVAKTVKVTFTKKTLKAIKKALQARKKLVATVVVTERVSASTVKHRTLKITIRR